jgi:polyhydroxyalkanoate synthesis regulator phasin
MTDDEYGAKLTEIEELVDETIAPDNMSAEDALEFLEELHSDIGTRIAGLREDLRE